MQPLGSFPLPFFNSKGNAGTYFDVIDTGFRVDFAVEFSGFSMNTDDNCRVHINLYTKDHGGSVFRLSPDSRDYEIVLAYASVPAPSPVFFLFFALTGLAAVRKFRVS